MGNPTDSTTATDFVATVPADRPSVDTNATPLVTPEPPPSDGASDDIERSPDTLAPAANIDVEPDAAPDATASGDADSTGADITLQIAELPDTAIAGRPGPAPLAGGSDSLPQVVVEPSGAVGDTSAALDSDDVVGRTADIDEPAPDPLLCSDPATPGTVLSSLLLSDPLGRVEELYQPTDADDERTKTELMEVLESAQRLRASTRAVRNEATSSGCNWVMQVDFAWTNAFGQPRGRSVEFRLELVNDGGAARVERIFDASPP